MTMVSDNVEHDTRERILVVAERLFREIGIKRPPSPTSPGYCE